MLVPGIGPPNARIAIIGEAPGQEEEQQGLPFVGASGKLLNYLLSQAGINRHECYITNVIKVRPPSNNFSVFYEDGEKKTTPSRMLSDAYLALRDEIGRIRPNVTLLVGSEALRAATGLRSIDSWRGSILPSAWGKCVATYHTARCLREYTLLPIIEHDIRRCAEESTSRELNLPEWKFELNPAFQRVTQFLGELIASPRPIAFDIETTRGDIPHTRCIGIADSATHAVCIPLMSSSRQLSNATRTIFAGPTSSPQSNSHWSEDEERAILTLLERLLADPAIPKFGQNLQFDAAILGREFGFHITGIQCDTMVAAHTMYCELPKGLDFLASIYTRIPYWSDYDASVDDELWKYNCFDCVATYEIAQRLLAELEGRVTHPALSSFTSREFYDNHIQPAMITMVGVGKRGILQDIKVRDELKTQFTGELEPLKMKFSILAGGPTNPASPKQLKELFYDKLKLPVQSNPRSKVPTTDEKAIDKLRVKAPQYRELFDTLIEIRKLSKLISTYLECNLTSTNRLVTSFNICGTVTGRCNSSATVFNEGTNLQNFPHRTERGRLLRRMFIADPGYILIKADLSQAEFRIVCWLAQIERLIKRYCTDSNFDVHKWVASLIYRVSEKDVTKTQRSVAKNGVYGGNYKMQPARAAITYGLALAEAEFVLREYRTVIPEIPRWWLSVEGNVNSTRTLTNPLGRVRMVMDRLNDATYRDCYSHECQSIVADIIHRSSIVLGIILPQCPVLLQVHDELVLQSKADELEHNLRVIKNVMEYPLAIPGVAEPLIIPAELGHGPNWLDMKKWEPA